LTIPEGDVDAWADTLVRLLTDQAWAGEMRSKIRRFAEATSWANVGKMHLATYAKLLERT
jgi:glycosyltransferase involved in cell wall biosynthesis